MKRKYKIRIILFLALLVFALTIFILMRYRNIKEYEYDKLNYLLTTEYYDEKSNPYLALLEYINDELYEEDKIFFTDRFLSQSEFRNKILKRDEKLSNGFNNYEGEATEYLNYSIDDLENEETFDYYLDNEDGKYILLIRVVYDNYKRIDDAKLIKRALIRDSNNYIINSWRLGIDKYNYQMGIVAYCCPSWYDYSRYDLGDGIKQEKIRVNGAVTKHFIDKYGYDEDCFGVGSRITNIYIDEANSSWEDKYVIVTCTYGLLDLEVKYKVNFYLTDDNKLNNVESIDISS